MLFLLPADARRDPTDYCDFKGLLDVKHYSSFVSNVWNKFGFHVTAESQQGNILLRGTMFVITPALTVFPIPSFPELLKLDFFFTSNRPKVTKNCP